MFAGVFVILVSLQSIANGAAKNFADPKPIKYPGPIQEVGNRYGTPVEYDYIPDDCRNKTFCTIKPDDYPEDEYNHLFKGYTVISQPSWVFNKIEFDDRQGDPTETNDCKTKITYEPLYKVKGDDDVTWRTVIQAPHQDFVQRVRLEECSDTKSSCFKVISSAVGIKTHCRQTITEWELLVDDGNGGSEKVTAKLPTCCSCVYKP